MNLPRTVGVHVRLGASHALEGVSVAVEPGWTAIVGPNGAGKSTLLRVLAGLQPPHAGTVSLGTQPLAAVPARERARRVAWLGQQGEVVGELTAEEVVGLGRLPHRGLFAAPTGSDAAAVAQALAATESTAWAHRRLGALSGGERQRVLIARALAVQARCLLLDEPTTHLDPPHQVAVVRLLRERAAAGDAVVSVLHDLSLALRADRVWVMAKGRLVHAAGCDDPALHEALEAVFEGAVRIARLGGGWVAVPRLD